MKKVFAIIVAVLFSCSNEDEPSSCIISPALTTNNATNILQTSATLSGTINFETQGCFESNEIQQGFVYGTSPLPSTNNNIVTAAGTSVNASLTNLEPDTTYYVRTFVNYSNQNWYGNEVSFTTLSNNIPLYGVSEHSVVFQDISRNYIMYVPESYTTGTPTPIVFAFHGFGGQNFLMMNNSNFNSIADQNNFIVVYPQGTLFGIAPHWNVGGWTSGSTVDDVAFVDYLLSSISSSYNIDAERVYATGMSNGGFFSFLLACQLSDTFAAIASVTGSMTTETLQNCSPSKEIPVLQIHGTEDVVVPYDGGFQWNTPIEDVLTYWAENNDCESTPSQNTLGDLDPNNLISIDHIQYNNGANGTVVSHYKINGGGHEWYQNGDFDTSQIIWEFFSSFDRNGAVN